MGTISIIVSTQSLLVSQTIQLNASALDNNNNPVGNVQMSWSSSNESILTVDQVGLVTGISEGQAKVFATAEGYKSDSTLISVISNTQQLASIVVTPNSAFLMPGETQQFTAVGYDGNNQELNGITFTWTSSNSNIVSVDNNGLATANSSGSAFITASSNGISSSDVQIEVSANSKIGNFMGNPSTSYTVSGTAELVSSNGQLTLTLYSDFQSSSGPGLHVYLSNFDGVGSESVDLGELQSNSGMQSYQVPTGYTLAYFTHVIIYCKPFSVQFGSAQIN
jgi:uncharacterized protein YjdB